MRLVDLNPEWMQSGGEGVSWADTGEPVPRHICGVAFDCPCGCGKRRLITFKNPPGMGEGLGQIAGLRRSESGWERTGDTFETLTLRPSIWAKRDELRPENCDWHGFLTDGVFTSI